MERLTGIIANEVRHSSRNPEMATAVRRDCRRLRTRGGRLGLGAVTRRGRRGVAGEAAAAEAWSPLAAGELFHHEAGAAARDMGDDGRATMNFRDQS